jgi:hypothetical protein
MKVGMLMSMTEPLASHIQTLRPGLTKLDSNKPILFQTKPQTAILTKKLPALGGTVGAPTLQEFSTPVFEKGINWLDRKRVFP